MRWTIGVLLLLGIGCWVVSGITIISNYNVPVRNSETGEITLSYFFFMRCTQSDNAARFLAFNISWNNDIATNHTVIKIVCAPPQIVYSVSPVVLMTPFSTSVVTNQICTETNSSIGFLPSQEAVPPGTPLSVQEKDATWVKRYDRGRHSSVMQYHPEVAHWKQRAKIDQRLERHPTDVTRGSALFKPLLGPIAIGLIAGFVGGVVGGALISAFNPSCWFGGCGDNGLSALTARLDNMILALGEFADTLTQLAQNQQAINEQFAKALTTQSIVNDNLIRAQQQQQLQIDAVKRQVDMLKEAVEVISQQQVTQGIVFSASLRRLQTQVNKLVDVVANINDATQAQIAQHTGWIRNILNMIRMMEALILNLKTQQLYKTDVVANFFEILDLTNSSLLQPYLTSSEFQPPQPELTNAYSLIDTLTIQYTYQEDPQSPPLAVNSNWEYRCLNSFVLSFPRLGVTFIDLIQYFGPADCLSSIAVGNSTCQCYWTIQTFTAPIFFSGQSPRPFPFGFPPANFLDCRPLNGDMTRGPACTGGTAGVQRFSDPDNTERDSIAALVYSVGSYAVMENSRALDSIQDTFDNTATSMFDVLRKLCYQQTVGKVQSLATHGSFDWSVGCGGADTQPCFARNPPSATTPFFVYGPQQDVSTAGTDYVPFTYTELFLNSSTRIISANALSFWDMPSVPLASMCPLTTENLNFAYNRVSGSLGLYEVFFGALETGYNLYIDVYYPSLQTNVTGIMPPDVAWRTTLFTPQGTVNGGPCDISDILQASAPINWQEVTVMEQRTTSAEINVTYIASDGVTPLAPPVLLTDTSPIISFPLPPVIRLVGPRTFNAPDAYTFDTSDRVVSTDNNAISRANTVTYAALPPDAYADALFRNIPLQAIWAKVFGKNRFQPQDGANSLDAFLQFLTPWTPNIPQHCLQDVRLAGGWCNILDNYAYFYPNNTALFANFQPTTQWTVDFSVELLTDQIVHEQQSTCPLNDPSLFNLIKPGQLTTAGQLQLFNPENFDNVLLYSVATSASAGGCGVLHNVPITIPAQGGNVINFPPCQTPPPGTQFIVTFSIPGPLPTLCAGEIRFDQNGGSVIVPGSQPPNVESFVTQVQDRIGQEIAKLASQTNAAIVDAQVNALKGPSQATFDQLYAISNQTLDDIFAVAANLTGCNIETGKGCGVDKALTNWDNVQKEFEEANKAAKNATAAAEDANKQLKQDLDAINGLNEFGKNLTDKLVKENDALQESIVNLHNEIQNYLNKSPSGLSTIAIVIICILVVAALAIGIYLLYKQIKKKDDAAAGGGPPPPQQPQYQNQYATPPPAGGVQQYAQMIPGPYGAAASLATSPAALGGAASVGKAAGGGIKSLGKKLPFGSRRYERVATSDDVRHG